MGVHHQYQPEWETNPGPGCWVALFLVFNLGALFHMWAESFWAVLPVLIVVDAVVIIGGVIFWKWNKDEDEKH